MTIYLLDENMLRGLHSGGHENVRAWFAGVPDADLGISVMTLLEKRRGWERRRGSDPERAAVRLSEIDAFEAANADRIVPVDAAVVAEWIRLLGAMDTNQRDRALAATARVHGFVLVTRNVDRVRGCEVDVLDPFRKLPRVERVRSRFAARPIPDYPARSLTPRHDTTHA